jgi:ketol-acid reductoisomerase
MATMTIAGVEETVVTRSELPLSKAQEILKNEIIAVLGYGVQGPAQALNLRDNGFHVIIGQRQPGASWDRAVSDGWQEGKNLFTIEEAANKGTILLFLLSDAGQIAAWPGILPHLTAGKTLCFSHGFGLAFSEHTHITPPDDIDVVLVAPKGSGRSVRTQFLEGRGINASIAVHQDSTGHARDTVAALGIGMGAGYLFETTFEKEVFSDLVGERGVLMGALAGVIEAQYNLLRERGHTPSEAFNETVEELTQSLVPLIAEQGMDWMFANCSTTAQTGALKWRHKFREAVVPVFHELYESVQSGLEAQETIFKNSRPDYRQKLDEELHNMRDSELWQAGSAVRALRK